MVKKRKTLNIKIFILIIILIYIFIFLIYQKNKYSLPINIKYINENLDSDLQFDVIYSAPHYSGNYDAYKFNGSEFILSDSYVTSTSNTEVVINESNLDDILLIYDDIDSYTELRYKDGQISLIRTYDDYTFYIFDGFITGEEAEKGKKINLLYKFNNSTKEYIRYKIEMDKAHFVEDFIYIDNLIYLIASYNSELLLYEVFEDTITSFYSITDNGQHTLIEKLSIHNDILIGSYIIEENIQEVLFFYDIKKKTLLYELNVDNDLLDKASLYDRGLTQSIYKNDSYYFYRTTELGIQELIIEDNFDTFKDVNIYVNNFYENIEHFYYINDVFVYKDNLYILILNTTTENSIYKIMDNKLEKLLNFELKINPNNIFYCDFKILL